MQGLWDIPPQFKGKNTRARTQTCTHNLHAHERKGDSEWRGSCGILHLNVTRDSLNIPTWMERDHGGVGRGKAGGRNDQNTLSMCMEFSKNKAKILLN